MNTVPCVEVLTEPSSGVGPWEAYASPCGNNRPVEGEVFVSKDAYDELVDRYYGVLRELHLANEMRVNEDE